MEHEKQYKKFEDTITTGLCYIEGVDKNHRKLEAIIPKVLNRFLCSIMHINCLIAIKVGF